MTAPFEFGGCGCLVRHSPRSRYARPRLHRFAKGTGSGLFEEGGDFVEEGWEFLLDDFPDFLVSDFGVSMD